MTKAADGWKIWGDRDPYYAVLTTERFRKAVISENRDEFFRTGEEYVDFLTNQLGENFGTQNPTSALDFGCGVGRISLALAKRYGAVTGLDISSGMIDEANANKDRLRIENASFCVIEASIPGGLGEFSLVHSYLTFQHIPKKHGMKLIGQLADRVAPGGTLAIQLSLARKLPFIEEVRYILENHIPMGGRIVAALSNKKSAGPPMLASAYSCLSVLSLLASKQFTDIRVIGYDHSLIPTGIFIARKKGAMVQEGRQPSHKWELMEMTAQPRPSE